MIEVELKFRVDSLQKVKERLISLGARLLRSGEEVDIYLQHPCRDFGRTDEALRVRFLNDKVTLTYKGPRYYSAGKARVESNVVVEGDVVELLRNLGFKEFARLEKRREVYLLEEFAVYLDEVKGLGNFVEVELVVSNEGLIEEAAGRILELAPRLDLSKDNIVGKTYLELFLSSEGGR